MSAISYVDENKEKYKNAMTAGSRQNAVIAVADVIDNVCKNAHEGKTE
jgi:hypothetical protein